MRSIHRMLAMALPGLLLSAPATAQSKPAAAVASPAAGSGRIEGFRSARFGQTESDIRAAIAADFKLAPDSMRLVPVPGEGTEALVVAVSDFAPGPGPAQISYVLGATSHRLVRVNIVWTKAAPSDNERARFAAAGVALSDYFRQLPVQPKASGPGGRIGPNSVAMYVAADDQGAALEVCATGIAFEATDARGAVTKSPVPNGPAILRLSYIANALKPDIKVITPGSF